MTLNVPPRLFFLPALFDSSSRTSRYRTIATCRLTLNTFPWNVADAHTS